LVIGDSSSKRKVLINESSIFTIPAIADVANFTAVADTDPTFCRTILIVIRISLPATDNDTFELNAVDAKIIFLGIADKLDDTTTLAAPRAVFTIDVTIEAAELIADTASAVFTANAATLVVQFIADEAYAIFVLDAVSEEVALITINAPSLIFVPTVAVADSKSEIFAEARTILVAATVAVASADKFAEIDNNLIALTVTLISPATAIDTASTSSAVKKSTPLLRGSLKL
jgi:hypothetical protein